MNEYDFDGKIDIRFRVLDFASDVRPALHYCLNPTHSSLDNWEEGLNLIGGERNFAYRTEENGLPS